MAKKTVRYAGFWRRFVAWIVDRIILGMLITVYCLMFAGIVSTTGDSIVTALISLPFAFSLFLFGVIYYALFESSGFQATPGKMVLCLKVIDLNGKPITFGRSFGRNICKYISGLIFLIGYMMAGWTEKKQALHDKFMDCLVIRRVD